MPRYSFICFDHGPFVAHSSSERIVGSCPQCHRVGRRDFGSDLQTISVRCDDHIRRSYNGAKIDHALAEQQRPLDPLAPKDKFEARHIEKATGRVYIGDDVSGLSAKAQRAIINGKRRPGQNMPRY